MIFTVGLNIFIGILIALWLIGMIAARIHIVYDGAFRLYITLLGFIKIRIVPSDKDLLNDPDISPEKKEKIREKLARAKIKSKEKARKKKQKKKEKEALLRKKKLAQDDAPRKKKPEEKPAGKKKLGFSDIMYIVKLVLRVLKIFFKRFNRYLYIKAVKIKIKVASDDAAKTAIMYGVCAQSVAYILEILDNKTNIDYNKNAEVNVAVDYLAEKPSADIDIAFSLRVWHLLDILFRVAVAAVKKHLNN